MTITVLINKNKKLNCGAMRKKPLGVFYDDYSVDKQKRPMEL